MSDTGWHVLLLCERAMICWNWAQINYEWNFPSSQYNFLNPATNIGFLRKITHCRATVSSGHRRKLVEPNIKLEPDWQRVQHLGKLSLMSSWLSWYVSFSATLLPITGTSPFTAQPNRWLRFGFGLPPLFICCQNGAAISAPAGRHRQALAAVRSSSVRYLCHRAPFVIMPLEQRVQWWIIASTLMMSK